MSLPDADSNTKPAQLPEEKTRPASSSDATIVGPAQTGSMTAPVLAAGQPPAGSPPPPAEPPPSGPPPAASPPGGPDYSLPILIGVFVLALVGIGLLGLGIYAVMKLNNPSPSPVAAITATLPTLPTQVVLVPTTTPAPTATDTATPAPTDTEAPPTATSTAPVTGTAELTGTAEVTGTATGNVITVQQGANVRSGPGVNYQVVGSIKAGDTAPVIGRSAFGSWFVIQYSGGFGGQGWVSGAIATYSGNTSALPVVAAPPTPVPTATPKPAGNPSGGVVTGAHGVSGNLNLCSPNTVFGIGQRVCFIEWIHNNTNAAVAYGLLGVTAVRQGGGVVQFQTSWSGQGAVHGLLSVDPNCTGPTDRCKGQWEDGMKLNSAGTYNLTLNVCFSDYFTCRGTSGDWEVLSGAIVITVQ